MADQEEYTREDLDNMTRVQLRQTAVNCGKKHREATNMESEEIKEFVLDKQGGGSAKKGKGKGKAAPKEKAATTKGRGRGKAKPEPEDTPETEEAPADDQSDTLHNLGLGMDDNHKLLMEKLEEIQAENEELKSEVAESHHSLFLISGLITDVLKGTWGPEEVAERVEELENLWQEQSEGDEGND